MIWAILAILGVPLWLILGALGGTLWSRRRFRALPGVFPLATREPGKAKWPRMPAYGRVISDVIVVNRGVALQRTDVHRFLAVHDLELSTTSQPRGLEDPVGRIVDLDDGTTIELAISARDANQFDDPARRSPMGHA